MYKIAIIYFLSFFYPPLNLTEETIAVYFHIRLKLGKDVNQNKFELHGKENMKCVKN